MSIIIKGGITNNLAEVDSNNNLKVNLPTTLSGAGYFAIVGEVDDGSVLGTRTLRQLDASYDYRLRVGIDKIIWQDTFNHGVVNTSKYKVITSGMTNTISNGFLNLNANNTLTLANYTNIRTHRTFSMYSTYPVYFDVKAKFTNALQNNNIIEFGLALAASASTPTDGVFFRASGNTASAFTGVQNNNGTEQSVVLNHVPVAGTVYHYLIVAGMDSVEFWINDVLMGVIDNPAGMASPTLSNSLPILLRNYNYGLATTANQLNVGQVGVSMGDLDMGKDWASNMAGNGQSTLSAPDGQTVAQLANYANNAAPATATLSNTAGGYAATILGGQFQFAATASGETDYALFAYLNPAGTAAIPGKNLYITGVKIDTYNMVVPVATTATVFQWAIAVGSTGVSLATTDSGTAGTRAPRRVLLGTQYFAIATPVGGQADKMIDVKFLTPLLVEPGTYCHIILKIPLSTNTATEIFRGTCMINGYFE